MSETTPSRDEIAPDVLWAIEALETAREPTELGPAFAAAEREKKRLGAFWRLEFVFAVLTGLALALSWSVPIDAPYLRYVGLALLVLLLVIRITISKNSARVVALKRVNDALDRWRSLVPAMREIPE